MPGLYMAGNSKYVAFCPGPGSVTGLVNQLSGVFKVKQRKLQQFDELEASKLQRPGAYGKGGNR